MEKAKQMRKLRWKKAMESGEDNGDQKYGHVGNTDGAHSFPSQSIEFSVVERFPIKGNILRILIYADKPGVFPSFGLV